MWLNSDVQRGTWTQAESSVEDAALEGELSTKTVEWGNNQFWENSNKMMNDLGENLHILSLPCYFNTNNTLYGLDPVYRQPLSENTEFTH